MKTLECRGITLSDKQTKICVPITGTDLEEIKEQAEKIANMNPDVVEWRADFYDVKNNDETEFEQCLKAINDNLKKIPIIYTYRTSNEGGEKSIDVDEYCRLCKYVSEISEKYNVAMIDVELYENKDRKDIGKLLLDIKSTGVKVIGSNHHFEGTPSEKDIFNVLKTMEEAGADICKIALLKRYSGENLAGREEKLFGWLREMRMKGLVFPFYLMYPESWLREVQLFDKILIQYKAKHADSRVKLHYQIVVMSRRGLDLTQRF